ncbi:unnamed protein product [Cuscuta campestris]|uniref:Uncharacterized protein n=1 Tax=Cuscuta campestris TaxID=132261 RepID=A0A484LF58_9ASTE|nr:unnamed protein product [Cuscuta campestris]
MIPVLLEIPHRGLVRLEIVGEEAGAGRIHVQKRVGELKIDNNGYGTLHGRVSTVRYLGTVTTVQPTARVFLSDLHEATITKALRVKKANMGRSHLKNASFGKEVGEKHVIGFVLAARALVHVLNYDGKEIDFLVSVEEVKESAFINPDLFILVKDGNDIFLEDFEKNELICGQVLDVGPTKEIVQILKDMVKNNIVENTKAKIRVEVLGVGNPPLFAIEGDSLTLKVEPFRKVLGIESEGFAGNNGVFLSDLHEATITKALRVKKANTGRPHLKNASFGKDVGEKHAICEEEVKESAVINPDLFILVKDGNDIFLEDFEKNEFICGQVLDVGPTKEIVQILKDMVKSNIVENTKAKIRVEVLGVGNAPLFAIEGDSLTLKVEPFGKVLGVESEGFAGNNGGK